VDNYNSLQSTQDALRTVTPSVWLTRVLTSLAALLVPVAILLVYLFVDLLVWRGKIADYTQLPVAKQLSFQKEWESSLGTHPGVMATLARVRPADWEEPAGAAQRWEWRWQAATYHFLETKFGAEAANEYLTMHEDGGAAAPTENRLGILSLIVRERPRWTASLLTPLGRIAAFRNADETSGVNTPYLAWLFVALFAVVAIQIVLVFAANHLASAAGLASAVWLRRSVYNHANRLNAVVVRSQTRSEVEHLFTTKLETISEGIRYRLLTEWSLPLVIALVLVLLVAVNVGVALSFLLLCAVVWLAVGQFVAYFRRDGRIAARRTEARLHQMRESVSILTLVKCYLMDRFNQTRVERQLTDHSRAEWRRLRAEALAQPVLTSVAILAGIVILYLAGRSVLLGEMSLASLATKIVCICVLLWAVQAWLRAQPRIRREQAASAEVSEFLQRRADTGQTIDAEFLQPLEKKLELIEVSLRETGTGRMLLENVTMSVSALSRVAIVASDPDETHSLAYLLTRFLDPTGGEVRFDGKNTRWVTHESLRTQVAMVLQQNLIFSDTVSNNIGCGDGGFNLPQIIEAAKTSHAHQLVQRLPYGYETLVGDGGQSLRPGEKLRIALARAVLRDPSVIVIEEPELPMDEDSRALLDDAYERIAQSRTLIFFSRRQAVLRRSDKVMILHKGHVSAAGVHEDLLRSNDLYRHLLFKEITVPSANGVA
jgi:ATP-binding cassette, subfamily B, bacterial